MVEIAEPSQRFASASVLIKFRQISSVYSHPGRAAGEEETGDVQQKPELFYSSRYVLKCQAYEVYFSYLWTK